MKGMAKTKAGTEVMTKARNWKVVLLQVTLEEQVWRQPVAEQPRYPDRKNNSRKKRASRLCACLWWSLSPHLPRVCLLPPSKNAKADFFIDEG